MKLILAAACMAALSLASVGSADAKGCIKGAIVGGVAGEREWSRWGHTRGRTMANIRSQIDIAGWLTEKLARRTRYGIAPGRGTAPPFRFGLG
jgi:hypothetical protein